MINAVIIDDESSVRKDIKDKINSYFETKINVIAEAESVVNGVKIINKYQPDLLFLDIELTDGTSFDIIDKIDNSKHQIIFITGFNDKAIKAIKIGALDYILKPVDDDEFITAVNEAITNYDKKINIDKLLNVSNDFFKGIENKRIVLKTMGMHHIIFEDDITYLQSDGNYTTFHMSNGKEILISKPINKSKELITNNNFVRCHQSYVVNLDYVEHYINDGYLMLKDDIKVPVSSRRKGLILKILADL